MQNELTLLLAVELCRTKTMVNIFLTRVIFLRLLLKMKTIFIPTKYSKKIIVSLEGEDLVTWARSHFRGLV